MSDDEDYNFDDFDNFDDNIPLPIESSSKDKNDDLIEEMMGSGVQQKPSNKPRMQAV